MARCNPIDVQRAIRPMSKLPTTVQLFDIVKDDETTLQYLIRHGVIENITVCSECGGNVSRRNVFYVRCTTRNCRKEESLLKKSFFGYRSHLSCSQALTLAHYWLHKCSSSSIMTLTGHASDTVTNYLGHFRQLCAEDLAETDVVVGGPGVIVEVDESKFGKRKFHRGHRVEGVWVVGGVERTEERKCFAVPVLDRTEKTLSDIICRHVAPGSVIHTDCWKGYQLEKFIDLTHFTVNHSENFVDPTSLVHTNTIEGTWNGFKTQIPARRRTRADIASGLFEFIWRRRHGDNLWPAFIDALKNVSYEE